MAFQVLTALITPFKINGKVDYVALRELVLNQVKQGVDGFVVCGTTAETPTLSKRERLDILSFVIEVSKHCVPIYFGCGTNNTKETIHLAQQASKYDIDGLLLVTPYYNKPSQRGLYEHFKIIADHVDTNIMLYQVPSRCGVAFTTETLVALFEDCPNITALKHASADASSIEYLRPRFPTISFYSGEDGQLINARIQHMDGLVSVMANAFLPQMKYFLDNPDEKQATWLQQLAELTFLECSPSAIKYMLYKQHRCRQEVRLPLVTLSEEAKATIDAFIDMQKPLI